MCTCIEDLEKKLAEHLTEKKAYKKPIAKVEMMGRAFILTGEVGTRTKTDFEVTLEGQKKKDRVPVFHKFCPFCGEKKAA
jgi:hypothetical protein